MAITFPRDMPVGGVETQQFEIGRVDYVSPQNRGRVAGVQAGFPLWGMIINLANTTEDEGDDWSTFVDTLRGAQNLFYGCDLSRPFPKAKPNGFVGLNRAGGGSFDGSASTWSLNTTRDVITLTGLPANFVLSKRDYVGFKWGTNKRALVRCAEAVTGDGLGNLAISVEPPVPGGSAVALVPTDGSATLHFDNPKCLMRLVTQSTRMGARDGLHSQGGTITAIQDLLP